MAAVSAMNVNGRNAWKCGPFGAHILALDVLLATGEVRTLSPGRDPHALLCLRWQPGPVGHHHVNHRPATAYRFRVRHRPEAFRRLHWMSILAMFAEEEHNSDFMEAWLDGFASGSQLGRGHAHQRQR